MANEISKVADAAKWSERPELSEFEPLAEICTISGHYCFEVMDTSAADREPLSRSLANEREAWA